MPETIDWPARTSSRPQGRKFIFLAIVIAVILLGTSTFISYWVDMLWFQTLGYSSVFWTSLRLEWGVFGAFTVATFVLLYGAFLGLHRAHGADLPSTHTIVFGGQPVELPVGRLFKIAAVLVAALIALGTGAAMKSDWPVYALWWHAPAAAGIVDPILGKSLNFYLFTLPVWQLVAGWLLTMAVMICILAGLFLMVSGGGRALSGQLSRSIVLPLRGILIAVAFLLVTLAMRAYVSRFELLFEHHTIFDGVSYTDAHVNLGGMLIVAVALLIGALIALFAGISKPRGAWLAAALAPGVLCYVLVAIAGWYVTTFLVKPNQLDREKPYIADNIQSTRRAYGLDTFVQKEYAADTTVAALNVAANQATLENVRLWDVQALQDTLRQVQEIRTYYDFPDIDIDRYKLNGAMRQVMLGVRELNVDKLPESSRNWINDKLIYTHGYGVTMNPVNGFTAEGLPSLYLSNMPVESTVPGLSVTRPEIYFGELTNTDVYVNTGQKEFNYPEGPSNNLSTYQGKGGILMGGFLRRALLAFDRGDLTKVPFSDDIGAESRLLMRRNVRDRLSMLAPFLAFDADPYIVVGEDGRLRWILDGFTSSDTYPYATHTSLNGEEVNYVRNSVKAVIDAYDGSTTLYVFDNADPIVAAWRGIFPELFKDASEMPASLRAHVRYPDLLLSLQADVYALYHMTDPEVFYNREDQWSVATQGGSGDQGAQDMPPSFVQMTLPGEQGLEFVEILPFTPVKRNNMIGWIAARSDGAHYGTAEVFDFPKTRLVDGPQQIEARIDQNAQLSGQLTLWNQQGSHVRRGSLLVIPCGTALLYAEPIYLQAQQSPMPELRIVVLALQDRLAYGPNFETAAASLFGSGSSSLSESVSTPTPAPNQPGPGGAQAKAPDTNELLGQASRDFNDYEKLTSAGKLSEAGQKLDDLKRVLDQLNNYVK